MHCADVSTLKMVEECIANDEQQTNLVEPYHHREIPEDHPISLWKRKARTNQNMPNLITSIALAGLDSESLNGFVAAELNLEEEETLLLARLLLTWTHGNLFFVLQLLDHWQKVDVLSYDLNGFSSRWKWNINKIQATALTENVIDLVSSRLHCHPPNIQRVLQLAACLGFLCDVKALSLLKEVFSEGEPIRDSEAIDFCVKERLLERLPNGQIMYFH